MAARIVLDTNVLVAGLRSRSGASFRLLSALGQGHFDVVVSVPVVLEYEEVLLRNRVVLGLSEEEVGTFVDYVCSIAHHQQIFFMWRPILPDPADDMLLEVAANGQCEAIVTFNTRHFVGVERFGVRLMRPVDIIRAFGVPDGNA